MSHRSRLVSEVRINAPLRVPTKTRTPLILLLLSRFSGVLYHPGFAFGVNPACRLLLHTCSMINIRKLLQKVKYLSQLTIDLFDRHAFRQVPGLVDIQTA